MYPHFKQQQDKLCDGKLVLRSTNFGSKVLWLPKRSGLGSELRVLQNYDFEHLLHLEERIWFWSQGTPRIHNPCMMQDVGKNHDCPKFLMLLMYIVFLSLMLKKSTTLFCLLLCLVCVCCFSDFSFQPLFCNVLSSIHGYIFSVDTLFSIQWLVFLNNLKKKTSLNCRYLCGSCSARRKCLSIGKWVMASSYAKFCFALHWIIKWQKHFVHWQTWS